MGIILKYTLHKYLIKRSQLKMMNLLDAETIRQLSSRQLFELLVEIAFYSWFFLFESKFFDGSLLDFSRWTNWTKTMVCISFKNG